MFLIGEDFPQQFQSSRLCDFEWIEMVYRERERESPGSSLFCLTAHRGGCHWMLDEAWEQQEQHVASNYPTIRTMNSSPGRSHHRSRPLSEAFAGAMLHCCACRDLIHGMEGLFLPPYQRPQGPHLGRSVVSLFFVQLTP